MNTIWKCRFCNETQIKRDKIVRHETKCMFNPGNKLCYTCKKLIRGAKTCNENIVMFNVYTSGIACSKWSPIVKEQPGLNHISP